VADEEGLAPKAESIEVDKLTSAVQAAVQEVSSKHGVKIGNNLVFQPGILIGRQLMERVTDLAAAERMAADLAGHVQRTGAAGRAKLLPGVLSQGGRIILGYFPMEQVYEVPAARA
jgi:hypothetical protein